MDSFDWNRLAAASVLSVCILASGWEIGYLLIRNTSPINPAFTINNQSNNTIDLSSANIIQGQSVTSQQCSLCHTFGKDEPNKIGPNLYDIVGRKIASRPNFNYSESLRKYNNKSWDIQKLNIWLQHPTNFAPDTIMAYPGVLSTKDRSNIIAYLKSISPSATKKDVVKSHKSTIPEMK